MATRPTRGNRLIGPIAFGGLSAITALAFGRVFAGSATTWRLLLAALLSAGLAGILERRSLWLSAVVSAAALFAVLGWAVFPGTLRFGLPTPSTLHAVGHAARLVGTDANVQAAPAAALPPLVMAALVAVWAATFSAHSLGIRSGSPLLSLVPPLALVAFADTVLNARFGVLYGALFLCGGLAVVYSDGLRRVERWGPLWVWPSSRRRTSVTTARGMRRVGAAALGTALVAPLVLPGFGTKAVFDLSSHGPGHVQIDPLVSIGAALGNSEAVPILSLTSPVDSYLRLTALDTYEGGSWLPNVNPADTPVAPFTTLAKVPDTVNAGQAFSETVTFTNDFTFPWLPAPSPAESLTAPSLEVHWDANTQTLVGPGDIKAGTSYQVQTQSIAPTPDQLKAVTFPSSPGNSPDTALPAGLPPQLLTTARNWTKGQTTGYGKVLAILDHFQSSEFHYDPSVARRDDPNAIVDFLDETHAGFCQQFAGSMAVLLRELEIPARVAVGFDSLGIAGENPGTYELTTQQLHAWVEVDFPGIGWLPFDPTPGRSNPAAETYASHQVTVCQIADRCGGPGPGNVGGGGHHPIHQLNRGGNLNEGKTVAQGNQSPAPLASDRWPSAGRIFAWALLVGLFTLALYPVFRTSARSIRLRRARGEPRRLVLATFSVFASRAGDLGLARLPHETPREYGARLAKAGPLDDPEVRAFAALAARAAYGPAELGDEDARLASDVSARMIAELRRSTPVYRRALGLYRRG